MPTVAIHAPKSPVTTKSNGVAAATVPNVCKMPGPPAPFVPVPLPNVGRSGDSPKDFSTTVTIEGAPVAIDGATFGSAGDIASKPQGGGVISAAAHGRTAFVAPGTMDVRMEGKGVHLLGDPTFNNCGPNGSPANAATMAGVLQGPALAAAAAHGVVPEVQEICDVKCDCQASGGGEQCVWNTLWERDAASGYARTVKAQVPYEMRPPGGGPPRPYMSQKDPRRATKNWYIPRHRRPDAVIVRNGTQPPYGDNIRAVVEIKMGDMGWSEGQERAYQRIAGGRSNLIVLDDENCRCPKRQQPEPEKVPVMVEKPERRTSRDASPSLSPVAVVVTALALVAAAVAIVASAPVAATAAAAVALVAAGSDGGGAPDAI